MTNEFQVGVITQTHGIRGEVKVFPTTDDSSRFKKLKVVTADTGKERYVLHVTQVKYFKQFVILKFQEYNNINDVEFLKNAKLIVDRDHAVKLEKNEYYIADLIGLKVFLDTDEELGILSDVLQTGANDVYVVSNNDKEVLIPAIKECILEVAPEKGYIRVHLLEGLL